MNRFTIACLIFALAIATCTPAVAQETLTPTEARAIAKEAYIYGYPMVDSYRIQHAYFVDPQNPEFKARWNQIKNIPRVFTPDDKAVQTPNSDTPYSMLGLDLRAEPIVISVPAIQKDRYYSIQLVDAYTYNFAYIGSRTTGNDAGNFLLAGPNWKGETPKGIKKVIQSETELVLAIYRTQLFNPADLQNVKQVQAGYRVQPLSEFLGQRVPKAVPAIDFVKPLTPETQKTSLEFFNILNFVLSFCPTVPSEKELMTRFAKIGIGAGKPFDLNLMTPERRKALEEGMADAWTEFGKLKPKIDAKEVTSGDTFGTREHLKNNYLYRMAAAVVGIYGNSREEAIYPIYSVDDKSDSLTGTHRYTLRFGPGQLPPVNAFWSLTMYQLPESLLVENPLDRYLINSPMLPNVKKDPDGGLTLYIQNESPGKELESNWLPAPKGPFLAVLRLYWPEQAALDGTWTSPPMKRID
jgi:hypothetical protein